jgi:hypothetical protein
MMDDSVWLVYELWRIGQGDPENKNTLTYRQYRELVEFISEETKRSAGLLGATGV